MIMIDLIIIYSVKDTEKSMKSISNVYEKNQVPKLLYNRFTGSDIRVRDDSMNCAHVAIALKAPSYKDEDFVAMEIASAVNTFEICCCHPFS